jgi:WD40 repeat protein
MSVDGSDLGGAVVISSRIAGGHPNHDPVGGSRSSFRIAPVWIATLIGMVEALAYAQDGAKRECPEAAGRPRPLVGHSGPLYAVAFSPDGCRVATGEDDGTVRVYDAADGRLIWSAADPLNAPVYSLAFSLDGSRVAAGGRERWEAVERGAGRPGERSVGSIVSVAKGGKVRVWAAADGRAVGTIPGLANIRAVKFLGPDGTRIVTVDRDFHVAVRALDTGQDVLAIHDLAAHGQGIGIASSFSADGQRIAVQSDAPEETEGRPGIRLKFWDLKERRARQLDLPRPASGPVALSPGGTRLIVGEVFFVAGGRMERRLNQWDFASGNAVAGSTPMRIQLSMDVLTLSPTGDLIVSAGDEKPVREERTVIVWDSRTGRRLREVRAPHGRTRAVAFLPGRVRVASAGFQSDERDAATGRLKATPLMIWEFDLARRPD